MTYELIGGPVHGRVVSWHLAKHLLKSGMYRSPTLAERHAWGWDDNLLVSETL